MLRFSGLNGGETLDGFLVDFAASEGETGTGTFGMNESSLTRVYELDNTNLEAQWHFKYVKELLGYATVATSAGVNYIKRVVPHSIGRYGQVGTLQPFLFASKCGLKGRGPKAYTVDPFGADFPVYNRYRYDVEYNSLPFDIKTDSLITQTGGVPDESYWQRYVTKIAKPAGEFFSLPTSKTTAGVTVFSYKYVTGGMPDVQQSIGKLLCFCNLQVTHHMVPETACPSVFVNPTLTSPGAIDNAIGKVNAPGSVADARFNGYPVGTLLLLGVQMTPHRSPFGNRIYDICFLFKFFQPTAGAGHNYLFRPLSNAWLQVSTDGADNFTAMTPGKSPYDFADFRAMFRPPV